MATTLTACNDIFLQYCFIFETKRKHGLRHTVSDTRSRTRGLGHTVSDTRSRTHGVGHTVSDWIAMLQNKGNPPCGRTPTVLQPSHHLICTSTEGNAPRGVPHRFQGSMRDWRVRPLHLSNPSLSFPGASMCFLRKEQRHWETGMFPMSNTCSFSCLW